MNLFFNYIIKGEILWKIIFVKTVEKNLIKKNYKNGNNTTPYRKHKQKCDKIKYLINKYNVTKEFLENELKIVGTVSDFIKKYPEIGRNAYDFFHMFGIEVSIKSMMNITNERRRKTNLEKYGCEHNFCKSHPSRKEWEERLLNEEGIVNVFQRDSVKEQIKETLIKNYGVDVPYRSEEIKEKGRKTSIDRYGYDHWMKNPEKLEQFMSYMTEKLGYRPTRHNNYIHNNHGIPYSKPHKICSQILQDNNIEFEIEFILKMNNNLYEEGMNKYYYEYDIKINNSNKLVEVNGDYYHANPIKYKESDILNFFGNEVHVKEIWNKDRLKIDFAKKSEYSMLVIWEHDIYNNLEKVKKELIEYARNEN